MPQNLCCPEKLFLNLSVLRWNLQVTWNSRSLSLKSFGIYFGLADFEIMFKCMSAITTKDAKFIMPLQEKMSYDDSFDKCDRFGFTNQFYDLP